MNWNHKFSILYGIIDITANIIYLCISLALGTQFIVEQKASSKNNFWYKIRNITYHKNLIIQTTSDTEFIFQHRTNLLKSLLKKDDAEIEKRRKKNIYLSAQLNFYFTK